MCSTLCHGGIPYIEQSARLLHLTSLMYAPGPPWLYYGRVIYILYNITYDDWGPEWTSWIVNNNNIGACFHRPDSWSGGNDKLRQDF